MTEKCDIMVSGMGHTDFVNNGEPKTQASRERCPAPGRSPQSWKRNSSNIRRYRGRKEF